MNSKETAVKEQGDPKSFEQACSKNKNKTDAEGSKIRHIDGESALLI